jgi:hypothetical protein
MQADLLHNLLTLNTHSFLPNAPSQPISAVIQPQPGLVLIGEVGDLTLQDRGAHLASVSQEAAPFDQTSRTSPLLGRNTIAGTRPPAILAGFTANLLLALTPRQPALQSVGPVLNSIRHNCMTGLSPAPIRA